MTWTAIGKIAVKLFTTASINRVVSNVIDTTTPADASRLAAAMTRFGGFVISGMIADAAGDYVVKEIDGVLEAVNAAKNKSDEQAEVIPASE